MWLLKMPTPLANPAGVEPLRVVRRARTYVWSKRKRGVGRSVKPTLALDALARKGERPEPGKKLTLVPAEYCAEAESHLSNSLENEIAVVCLRKPMSWKSSNASKRRTSSSV